MFPLSLDAMVDGDLFEVEISCFFLLLFQVLRQSQQQSREGNEVL